MALNGFTDDYKYNLNIQNQFFIDSNADDQKWILQENKTTDNFEIKREDDVVFELTPAGDTVINNDLVVNGDMTINGNTTLINTQNISVEDSLIKQANNNPGDSIDIGNYGLYIDGGITKFTGLFRDATTGEFSLFTGLQEEPTTTVNTLGTGYTLANLNINQLGINGDLDMNNNDILNVNNLITTTMSGTLTTASQPNITSVGTLSSLTMSGNIEMGNNDINNASMLQVIADTNNQGNEGSAHSIKLTTGTNTQTLYMGYDGTADIGYVNVSKTGSTRPLCFQTRGDKVGIGVTNPSALLHILSNSAQEPMGLLETTIGDCSLKLKGAGGESYLEIANVSGGSGDASNSWGIGTNDDTNLHFSWGTNGTMNKDDKMVINSSTGFVGIDTANPLVKFHVSDGTALSGTNITTGVASFYSTSTEDTLNVAHPNQAQKISIGYKNIIHTGSGGTMDINNKVNTDMNFYTNNTLRMTLSNTGNLDVTGYVRGGSTGSLLNSRFLGTETFGTSTVVVSSTTNTQIVTYNYTPVSSSSRIMITFDSNYTIAGSGTADSFFSEIQVGGFIYSTKFQQFVNASGGGTRGATLFPISAVYPNSSTATKTITVYARRGTADDNINVILGDGCTMRIDEIHT